MGILNQIKARYVQAGFEKKFINNNSGMAEGIKLNF